MNLTVNGLPRTLQAGASVADLLAAMDAKPPFAVAVNTSFVPATRHAQHLLQPGDHVEVISPVTGG
ncbi:sulfur carrier protein ThiS [Simplicispira suum]|jgi:sulfur carrier protein|uniref:Thiamine biosynthesis protein ThiS n=1 Tax=Simplicispira suum TaxID=2109915 RepID=A0A2S0N3Z2_9BURK|nr:sulfur carrier protein ThiS [Simplicispira suum]AVO42865.1 thiamine biosynthesis protein ThiS [Simplicispira suum]MBW7834548.1 sulfur carrier protein ThiS [Simplicispira suum]